jgi:hypothetical protein
MKPGSSRKQGRSCLELIEEAVHLVRTAPASALAAYYVGTLPFVLGFFYFWIDMSRSPFAGRRLPGAALGMALLFLWMKCWQSIFTARLRASLSGLPEEPFTFARVRRIVIITAALQPAGLFVLPLAVLIIFSLPWVYAFFQNLTALADGQTPGLRTVVRKAMVQAWQWPRQNFQAFLLLAGFGLVIFLNWLMVCLSLPYLGKMLLGLESIFSRSVLSLLNSTFLMGMLGLTYLSLDPVIKALYTLRCFYGESILSGEDLKAQLRHHSRILPAAALLLPLLLLPILAQTVAQTFQSAVPQTFLSALRASSQSVTDCFVASNNNIPTFNLNTPRTSHPHLIHHRILCSSKPQVSPESPDHVRSPQKSQGLDRSIEKTLQQNKYIWREPRETWEEDEKEIKLGWLDRLLDRIRETAKTWLKWVGDTLDSLLRRIFGGSRQTTSTGSSFSLADAMHRVLYALIIAAIIILAVLIYRTWLKRQKSPALVASQPVSATPDLTAEDVAADQLPEDGWVQMARDLLSRGELRLAMRAFYLASLANLAERNLISLARFKSNRDYERELNRRAHAFPKILELFGENTQVFERAWYGLHEIYPETVQRLATNVELIRTTL